MFGPGGKAAFLAQIGGASLRAEDVARQVQQVLEAGPDVQLHEVIIRPTMAKH